MATFKIYPDCRRRRKDGTSQIKIVIYHAQGQRYLPVGIYVPMEHWDPVKGAVTSANKLYRQYNIRIGQIRLAAEGALLKLPMAASLADTASAVRAAVFDDDDDGRDAEPAPLTVVEAARRFVALKTEVSTIKSYELTIKHIERYDASAAIGDVGRAWLSGLDAHMALTSPSPNARAIHMRNLRAVFNYAIDEGLTNNYPFRKFKIRTVETVKRSLTAEQLRQLLTMEVEDWQEPYRDFFALSFYLIGTNAKDIMHLPAGADRGGRVEFNRAKTKKLYTIRVEPEARRIIERHRGVKYMVDILDSRTDHLQYIRQCNHALKMIGTQSVKGRKPAGKPLYPGISTYWARHSWATIAAELDIPKETIAAALGHGGNTVTDIYIRFNQGKVDEANRRVIDYVLYGKR